MMDEGALRVMQGFGKFLPMPSFAPYVYEKVRAKEAEARSTSAVIRTEVQISPNGDSVDEMPPPTPTKSNQAEKVFTLSFGHITLRNGFNQTILMVFRQRVNKNLILICDLILMGTKDCHHPKKLL